MIASNHLQARRLKKLESLAASVLGLHGFVMLTFRSAETWLFFVVAVVALLGKAGTLGMQNSWRFIHVRVTAIFVSTWILMFFTGGTASFFLLWYFVVASFYPLILEPTHAVIFSFLVALAYSALLPFFPDAVPVVVVFSRAFLLLFIGLLEMALAGVINRYAADRNSVIAALAISKEKLMQQADDLSSLYNSASVLVHQRIPETVLSSICELVIEQFGMKMAWVGLVQNGSFKILPAAASGFQDGYLDSIHITWDESPTGHGPTATAVRTKQPAIMNDIRTNPDYAPWRESALTRGYHSSAAFPLLVEDRVLGVLNMYCAEPSFFTKDRIKVLQSFANQSAVALDKATLFEQVSSGRQRLETLSQQFVEVQEVERRSLARELHDEIGQLLTGLKLTIGSSLRSKQKVDTSELIKAMDVVNELIARVREISLDLRPAMLDDFGLLHALLWYFDKYTERTGVDVIFQHANLDFNFPQEIKTAIFRIVQEALTNVARHAQESKVTDILELHNIDIFLAIEDQGLGFDLEAKGDQPTFGLLGMLERCSLLGGQFSITSTPGSGTRITCKFALDTQLERRLQKR